MLKKIMETRFKDFLKKQLDEQREKSDYEDSIYGTGHFPHRGVGRIVEASLSRLWVKATNNDFALFSTFRDEREKEVNLMLLNRVINHLNSRKVGIYLIDGHFIETNDVTKEETPVEESSILLIRPDDMEISDFLALVLSYMVHPKYASAPTKENPNKNKLIEQESALIGFINKPGKLDGFDDKNIDIGYYFMENDKTFNPLGKNLTFNKMGDNYSKMKNTKTPFVFEGVRWPSGTMLSHMFFDKLGILIV